MSQLWFALTVSEHNSGFVPAGLSLLKDQGAYELVMILLVIFIHVYVTQCKDLA